MCSEESPDYPGNWPVDITEREKRVCSIVCKSKEPVGFGVIKRETGLHQEIVSRTLKRLQQRKLISTHRSKYVKCCSV